MQNLSSGTCFVLPNGALGGAEFIQLSLIKKIKQQQPDHTIYVIFLTSCFTENWVPILDELQISYRCISKCRSLKTALIQSIPALIQYIKEFHVEQVFSSQVFINLLLCFLKRTKLLNQKVIVRESTQVLKRVSGYKKKLVEYLYRFYCPDRYYETKSVETH